MPAGEESLVHGGKKGKDKNQKVDNSRACREAINELLVVDFLAHGKCLFLDGVLAIA